MTRKEPDVVFEDYPCSAVAVGCALGIKTKEEVDKIMPEGLRNDGYLTLQGGNRFIRDNLPIKKYKYYKRGERTVLSDLLQGNTQKAIVLVLGHYVYAEGETYYSFFDNDNEDVIAVWWLKED